MCVCVGRSAEEMRERYRQTCMCEEQLAVSVSGCHIPPLTCKHAHARSHAQQFVDHVPWGVGVVMKEKKSSQNPQQKWIMQGCNHVGHLPLLKASLLQDSLHLIMQECNHVGHLPLLKASLLQDSL